MRRLVRPIGSPWSWHLAVVVVVILSTACSKSPGQATGPETPSTSYEIAGRVTSQATGQPISNALVRVHDVATAAQLAAGQTDAAGLYRLTFSSTSAAPSGGLAVLLTVEVSGYTTRQLPVVLLAGSPSASDVSLEPISQQSGTTEERVAAVTALQQFASLLSAMSLPERSAAMLAFIQTQPGFVTSGISVDGTVWAHTADGRMVLFVHSAPESESEADLAPTPVRASMASSPFALPSGRIAAGGALPSVPEMAPSRVGALPSSSRYRLLSGTSVAGDFDARPALAAMLEDHGYTGTIGDASVAELRSNLGDGVLYIRTHGGLGVTSAKDTLYALWTTDEVSVQRENSDPQLANDLVAGRIAYMVWSDSSAPHYGVTEKFMNAYMLLADNSLVYIDACSGALFDSFRSSFPNASMFVGWNERAMFSAMDRTARYVFDRLLGANVFDAESPKQRPFPVQALYYDPRFGAGQKYGYSSAVRDGLSVTATLDFYPIAGDFRFLAPSIRRMQMDEPLEQLTLYGLFGDDPGAGLRSVTVGGYDRSVKSWASDSVVVSGVTAQYAGPVQVKLRLHPSNEAPLTEWKAPFRYESDVSAIGGLPAGTLMQRVACSSVHIRADIHEYRTQPGHSPIRHPDPMPFVGARDSQCDWQYSGSGTNQDGGTTTVSGAGPLPWQDPTIPMTSPTLLVMGEIDAESLSMTFRSTARPGFFPVATGELTFTAPDLSIPFVSSLPLSPPVFDPEPVVSFGPTFGIVADSRQAQLPTSPPIPIRLEWDASAAIHPPDPQYAR